MTENGALLEVRDLRKEFHVHSGFLVERVSHTVAAVDGVSFSIAERPHARARRRVRLGEVHDGLLRAPADEADLGVGQVRGP